MIKKVQLNNYAFIQTNYNKNENLSEVNKTEKISKVEEIKKALENGTYKIDIHKTAIAMAKALMK
ncbi:flagellar biosynthesis anti-sigma factor FlgM [Caminibacter mediatlanticus TB-2]|uniref:Flagellar biosynthesis anti-sigma factor FlgM n=1 Tax=Caminibacter mediatlanticus TB-2 TaxID=391592 RepID=A0AAI9AH60_9BACT|nr:flagellar biosynthesis anti-sigma factor FlgM [Caminibacter mediatlanticus]EDM23547.1 hypothetical protein CMTB2_08427 [Caminibacter mediatlanticus TB-2]QCT94116.1 flagellar biosynthesis anti-sigma factor FlgM [Caminibacter mediatlanticus TB-2]